MKAEVTKPNTYFLSKFYIYIKFNNKLKLFKIVSKIYFNLNAKIEWNSNVLTYIYKI